MAIATTLLSLLLLATDPPGALASSAASTAGAVGQGASVAEAANPAFATASKESGQCLARRVQNSKGPQVDFVVMVPAAEAGDASAKGYVPAACPAGGSSRFESYKADMCRQALGNDAVQTRTEQVVGFTAVQLCTAALKLAGEPPLKQLTQPPPPEGK